MDDSQIIELFFSRSEQALSATADKGTDDNYHETPDNYAYLYNAYAPEQAAKLDEILAKYSLRAHTDWVDMNSQRQLCAALGIGGLITGDYDIRGDYIYDDGSFKAVGTTVIDGEMVWYEMFCAVRGSFSMIYDSVIPDGAEWVHVTPSGIQVIMAENSRIGRTNVVAGLEGCYVIAHIDTADRALAEAFADSVDWRTLNARFASETDRTAAAASVAAYMAEPLPDGEDGTEPAAWETVYEQERQKQRDEAESALGDWSITQSGYVCASSTGFADPRPGDGIKHLSVSKFYDSDGGLTILNYSRTVDMDSGVALNEQEFARILGHDKTDYSMEDGVTVTITDGLTVNGGTAQLVTIGSGTAAESRLAWLDKENDLIFSIQVPYEAAAQELIVIAESVG